MAFPGIAAVAGGVLGALAGSQGTPSRSSSNQWSDVVLKDSADLDKGRSELEALGATSQLDLFKQLQGLLQGGPGQAEVTAGTQAQNDLATRITNMLGQGGLPSQDQIGQANTYAQSIFNPQRVALQQNFQDQEIASQRLAARLGRAGNDPTLRNKLAQEQTRQLGMLNANQGAFAAEQAMGLPQRELQLAEALANVRGGLATQALQNRQTLLGLGQQLAQNERNYRIQTAKQIGASRTTGMQGGGLGGAISGGLAGFGTLAGAAGKMPGLFGG